MDFADVIWFKSVIIVVEYTIVAVSFFLCAGVGIVVPGFFVDIVSVRYVFASVAVVSAVGSSFVVLDVIISVVGLGVSDVVVFDINVIDDVIVSVDIFDDVVVASIDVVDDVVVSGVDVDVVASAQNCPDNINIL